MASKEQWAMGMGVPTVGMMEKMVDNGEDGGAREAW